MKYNTCNNVIYKKILITSLVVLIAYTFIGCKPSIDNIIHYNYFDTFTLTPQNIKDPTSLKVVCSYHDGRLSSIVFKNDVEQIIKDTIYYLDDKQYFVHDEIDQYIDDPLLNKKKIIRFLENDAVLELEITANNGVYNLFRVNKISKDNTYSFCSFNLGYFEKKYYNSVGFLLNDIGKLKVSNNPHNYELIEFIYNDNDNVNLLFVHYINGKRIPAAGTKKYISNGNCLYLDSLYDL